MRIKRIYTADPKRQGLAPEAPDGLMWTAFGAKRIRPSIKQRDCELTYGWDGRPLNMTRHYTNTPSYFWSKKSRRLKDERSSTQRRY